MSQAGSGERYLDGFWRHGRYYGSWKPGKYIFPIDSEELDRLDIFHKVFLVARDGLALDYALPAHQNSRILDLGTGTGIWPIHVTEQHPGTEVMAVDLNQIQPALIPPGMRTMQFDIEEPSWDALMSNCNLVHVRLLYGSIQPDLWTQIYRNAFQHLAPGTGYLQHTEVDWTPHWDGGDVPNPSAIQEWSERFLQALDSMGRSARIVPENTRGILEASGFVDIKEERIKCYVCPWSTDKKEREKARWFNLVLSHGLEAMSFIPMIDHLNMPQEEVRGLCSRAQEEACVLRFHTYMTFHVWTARRP